jgi:beta-glucosidase-like glycosyl hydrolase
MAQLILPFGAKYPDDYIKYNKTGLGATYPLPGGVPSRNDWQRWQVNSTRLGIPTSFIMETLHSVGGGTIFPMPCLQGSTWNASLVHDIAEVIGLEARVSGADRGFSPVVRMRAGVCRRVNLVILHSPFVSEL